MNVTTTLSDTDKKILSESAVFTGISEIELSPFLTAAMIKTFDAGKIIISSGDIGDGIYIILEGQVKVFLPQAQTDDDASSEPIMRISLATLQNGACFGEYSLVDQKEVSATVQALTPVRLGYLSRSDFCQIASTHQRAEGIIYKNLLQVLVARCREANKELEGGYLIY